MPSITQDPSRPNVLYRHSDNTWVYRVSAAGNCAMQLSLFRQGVQGAPPPESMQLRFDDGHLHEESIIRAIGLARPGWTIYPEDPDTGHQWEVEKYLREPTDERAGVAVVGHIDGLGINPLFNPDSRILEAKAFSRDNFTAAKKYDDGSGGVIPGFWDAYPYYRDSMTIYMDILEVPCIYGIKNKDSGETWVFDVPTPPGNPQKIYDRLLEIDAKVEVGEHYDSCDIRSYPCPMYRYHDDTDDELDPEDPEAFLDALNQLGEKVDPEGLAELERLCDEYDIARQAEKTAGELRKEIGRRISETYLGDPEDKVKVKAASYTVAWKDHTHRWLDEDAMREDGIDPDEYRRERVTAYPNVVKRRKK